MVQAVNTTLLPTVIVLTSGRGLRFAASGGTVPKLQAMLGDKTVLEHTLAAVRASGLPWYVECAGLPGMGDSIAAGVRATPMANGWLVLPGDLPLVQAQTLLAVAHALAHHPVVVPVYEGRSGHPVGFAPACREQLQNLEGNQGAAPVVRAQAAMKLIVKDAGICMDIDTVQDLACARLHSKL
jgi:molybdenum cofactor cytidylyltransferase